jgi:hypothetical protein
MAMTQFEPLPDYKLDPPEDSPECPECDAPLWGRHVECSECGWSPDPDVWDEESQQLKVDNGLARK